MSIYFPNSAIRVYLNDTENTGLYMPDGAFRVNTTDNTFGIYAPDGAFRGTFENGTFGFYDASGAIRMSETQSFDGSLFVQIVSTQEDDVDLDDGSGDTEDLNEGTIIIDGGFEEDPTIENDGPGKSVSGKSAGYAKFLYSIGVPTAGYIYTMTYDPDFSALSQQGKLAMVGFGFKEAKKYHFTGLKGDGDTGLVVNTAEGPNFDNLKSLDETSSGAPTNGTQAGPNYLQIEINEDGTTYTLRTSSDGSTWDDELTDDLPSPLTNSTDAEEFGIAIYLDEADKGSFTVDITLWEQGESAIASSGLFTESRDNLSSGTTFSACDFGAENANRRIVVAIQWNTTFSRILNSMTIGGVNATRATRGDTGGTTFNSELWYANVPTGTSGDVVGTWNSSPAGLAASLEVYSFVSANAAPTDTARHLGHGGNVGPISLTIDHAANSVVIAEAIDTYPSTSSEITFTEGVAVDADLDIAARRDVIAGSTTLDEVGTGYTITVGTTAGLEEFNAAFTFTALSWAL